MDRSDNEFSFEGSTPERQLPDFEVTRYDHQQNTSSDARL